MLSTNWQLSPLGNFLNRLFLLCPIHSSRGKLSPGRTHFVESEVDALYTASLLLMGGLWESRTTFSGGQINWKWACLKITCIYPIYQVHSVNFGFVLASFGEMPNRSSCSTTRILTGDSRTPVAGIHYSKKQNQFAVIPWNKFSVLGDVNYFCFFYVFG